MRVALGADHAGVHLKDAVRFLLEARGVEVQDFGTVDETSVDYPDYAAQVGRAVAAGEVDRGIRACGTGLGMAIAANKSTACVPHRWSISRAPACHANTTTPISSRSARG